MWNLLDQRTVDAPSLNAFSCLSGIRDNRVGFFMDYRSAKPYSSPGLVSPGSRRVNYKVNHVTP